MSSKASAAPTSRPVHPCVLSVFDGSGGGSGGVEYSTWAFLTSPRRRRCSDNQSTHVPNLVTAQSSNLRIYEIDENSGKMILIQTFNNIAGSVCYLETLQGGGDGDGDDDENGDEYDSLLIGFSGHPRIAVVNVSLYNSSRSSLQPNLLLATSLIDLTPVLVEHSLGSVTPLEHDLIAKKKQDLKNTPNIATLAIILGGGVAVAAITLRRTNDKNTNKAVENINNAMSSSTFQQGWYASDPYVLPLSTLYKSISLDTPFGSGDTKDATSLSNQKGGLSSSSASTAHQTAVSHGFGDMLSVQFLSEYSEPTICLLHCGSNGHAWPGRLGRSSADTTGTRYGLIVTAISTTVSQHRSAVLWSVEVPSDATHLISVPSSSTDGMFAGFIVVVCVNSIIHITHAGKIKCVLGMNGWCKSTMPSSLYNKVQCNPWPLPKLSIQLDGARLSFISSNGGSPTALVALRCGQLYLLQRAASAKSQWHHHWGLMPLGQTLGTVGNVADLSSLPYSMVSSNLFGKHVDSGSEGDTGMDKKISMGLVFAGSRLGDSSLLGFVLEAGISVNSRKGREEVDEGDLSNKKRKREDDAVKKEENEGIIPVGDNVNDLEYERILQQEEDALYAPVKEVDNNNLQCLSSSKIATQPDIVPPSDDEEATNTTESSSKSVEKKERLKLSNVTVVQSLRALDSITTLGPIGSGCVGPISRLTSTLNNTSRTTAAATTAQVLPCGFGSSGGLALVTTPGGDDRTIMAEADCLNAQCLFGMPHKRLVFLGFTPVSKGSFVAKKDDKEGIRILRLQTDESTDDDKVEARLEELDLENWCETPPSSKADENIWQPLYVLQQTTLISAVELNDDYFLVLIMEEQPQKETESGYVLVLFKEVNSKVKVINIHRIENHRNMLMNVTPMKTYILEDGKQSVSFGCTWSTGIATVVTAKLSSIGDFDVFENVLVDPTSDQMVVDDEEDEEAQFYQSERIISIDLFSAPSGMFTTQSLSAASVQTMEKEESTSDAENTTAFPNHNSSVEVEHYEFDEDDLELYGRVDESRLLQSSSGTSPHTKGETGNHQQKEEVFVGICRQSGRLQVYKMSDLITSQENQYKPIWEVVGFGHGVSVLAEDTIDLPSPRLQKVCTAEFRFFFSGPSLVDGDGGENKSQLQVSSFRKLHVTLETNFGDVHLYTAKKVGNELKLIRVPLGVVARNSVEQSRHRAKLRRKRIVSTTVEDDRAEADMTAFRYNRLHRFTGISGQDGIFAAISKPIWIVSERGHPNYLVHRCKHVAPAGGKNRPVVGFCSGLLGDSSFLTLYERIGRVGSQRLSIFSGLSNVYSQQGTFPGSGLAAEKITLGVTVRRIQFIDDASLSTNSHPLYVLLISREIEANKSELNNDGLTTEERKRLKDEKESEKIKKQVEADLGGFDVESEWVEEIERDDCFEVDTSVGGAPPIPQCVYSLWLVDASDNWNVVDSFELGEFEHGLTMSVMPLTEVADETSAATANSIGESDDNDTLFIALGTGLVDGDGEDVSSKGRLLLFEVKREQSPSAGSPVAELNLRYEKDILHGPVQTLSCLTCEGRSRLIVGAGADVNVEQWGNGKLTQVGFFRGDMHISTIMLFKNFFLLSDAYDSLYFLVWRESDKSLTLLAKDYEPIPVYSSGLISRGGSVSLICTDDRQNIQFFQYAPGESASRGGNKLVPRSDYHLGSQTIGIMENHYCRSSLIINSATPASTLAALKQQDAFVGRTDDDQRIGAYFGSTDGMVTSIIPLSEPTYWRLTALQAVITNALESHCSLSPKAYRLYRRTPRRGGCRNNDRKKNVIDGDLVSRFIDLPLNEQENLALSIGSTVDLILDNLLEIKCSGLVI